MYRVVGSLEDKIIRDLKKQKSKNIRLTKKSQNKSKKRALRKAQKLSHLLDNLYKRTVS